MVQYLHFRILAFPLIVYWGFNILAVHNIPRTYCTRFVGYIHHLPAFLGEMNIKLCAIISGPES